MTTPLYRADAAAERIAVPLDALTAIFHRPSGITHLVAAPVPEMLDALGEGPADAATLAARLARRHDLGIEGDDAAAVVAARLAELEAAGLVWRT